MPLVQALEAELERSLDIYRKQDPPLYFLHYEVTEQQGDSLSASYGAIERDSSSHSRQLDVDLRVGAPELDNTHPIRGESGRSFDSRSMRSVQIPIEDDAAAIRAATWNLTVGAFRNAQKQLIRVQTNRDVKVEESDPSPDFSSWKKETFVELAEHPSMDRDAWKERLRRISALFKEHTHVLDSSVSLSVRTTTRTQVNSEGSSIVVGRAGVRLSLWARAKAEDGMNLTRSRSFEADDPSGLPPEEELSAEARRLAAELKELRDAPLVEPYAGPAILEGRAAAVFFHEVLGHRLEGHRQKSEEEGQTFTQKVGEPILPEFLSIYDDPTIRKHNGTVLNGFYRYDNEGIPGARVPIVEKGVLKGFLLSRSPVKGFPRSNGHGRRMPGRAPVARQGNLLIQSEKSVPYQRLREMLLEELRRQEKPCGLIFEDISGGFTGTRRYNPQAFKVQPLLVRRVCTDGRVDEVVRGVDIVGTPLSILEKITATGDDPAVFNGTCGAESGSVPVSAVAPSLLVAEIEVEKKVRQQDRPPLLPPPLHDGGPAEEGESAEKGGAS
jgi:predicted Zn-dependent protease